MKKFSHRVFAFSALVLIVGLFTYLHHRSTEPRRLLRAILHPRPPSVLAMARGALPSWMRPFTRFLPVEEDPDVTLNRLLADPRLGELEPDLLAEIRAETHMPSQTHALLVLGAIRPVSAETFSVLVRELETKNPPHPLVFRILTTCGDRVRPKLPVLLHWLGGREGKEADSLSAAHQWAPQEAWRMAVSLGGISTELEPQLHAVYQQLPEDLKCSALISIAQVGRLACGYEAILRSALGDPSANVRIRGVVAAATLGAASRTFVPRLVKMLFEEPDCIEHQTRPLTRAGDTAGLDFNHFIGQDYIPTTTCFHKAVIEVLLNLENPPPEAVEALRAISSNPDRPEHMFATLRLWKLEHAEPELRRLIEGIGTEFSQRWNVIEALTEAGDRASAAAPALRALLATLRPDSPLAEHIRRALTAIVPTQGG